MINFSCRCGCQLSVPEELAGDSIQCPQCKRLADVPGMGDLENLAEDGTIKLDEAPALENPEAVEKMREAYLPQRMDDPDAADIRPTLEEVINAGADEIPLELADEVRPGAPKYDPVSGELIVPLELKKEPPPAAPPPVAGSGPTLHYAKDILTAESVSPAQVPLALLRPANAAVIAIVFVIHLLNGGVMVATAGGLIFAAFVILVGYLFIFAHYSNIVEETGPYERDEMPAPGRNLEIGEDLWRPFVHFAGALLICYVPVLIAMSRFSADANGGSSKLMMAVAMPLGLLGSFFFPAVFLTTTVSGTYRNLRPDRLLGVMRVLKAAYLPMVVLWLATGGVYFLSMFLATAFSVSVATGPAARINGLHSLIGYPVMLGAVYLMHLFCWWLGLLYRANHEKFPWILQRHVSTKKFERRIPRRRRRPAGQAPAAGTNTAPGGAAARPLPVEPLRVEPVGPAPVEPAPPRRIEEEDTGPIPLDLAPMDERRRLGDEWGTGR